MAQYYYDKFTAIGNTKWIESPWVLLNGDTERVFHKDAKTYSFDQSTGKFILGSSVWDYYEPVDIGDVAYFFTGNTLWRWTAVESVSQSWGSTKAQFHEKRPVEQTTYSKGSLVQANIVAEDGTYPNNGRHNDGYWYVKGSIVNTAPTTPGAFTQPSGVLEIGDKRVISWGASSDAESNFLKYILEMAINGGVWTQIAQPATNSYTYTIPTATSIKFRVKAVDVGGLESGYKESSSLTVSKPIYYWGKYNSQASSHYVDSGPWTLEPQSNKTFQGSPRSYTFSQFNNEYTTYGHGTWGQFPSEVNFGDVCFETLNLDAGHITRYTALEKLPTNYYIPVKVEIKYAYNNSKAPDTQGALVQSGIVAVDGTYPINGKHTDGFWYVRGSRVSESIPPPSSFTSPVSGKKFKPNEVANIAFGASNAANISLYEVDYRYNSIGSWIPLPYNDTLTRNLTITTDKSLKTLELRIRAKNTNNVYSDYVYSEVFEIEHNVAPTVSLTGPSENSPLYENDTFNIAGSAYDADKDQSVTVYYQIDNEPRKVLATNLSQTQISLSKQLKFKAGKLFDGDTAITGTLAEGVAHTLKVWAEDSEKASSTIIERSFYVVPNRAPLLTIDEVIPSGTIN
ncbi:hypothetical protein M5W82_07290, partial [Lysinibacillus xylanilyticus]|nr:hypothetical protein [Lysinibacillus xylanilyticus]